MFAKEETEDQRNNLAGKRGVGSMHMTVTKEGPTVKRACVHEKRSV